MKLIKQTFGILLAALCGCTLPQAVPGQKFDFQNGKSELKQDAMGQGLEASYYKSNGVVVSTLKIAGQFSNQNNPLALAAAAKGQSDINASVGALVDQIEKSAVDAGKQAAAAYFTGGASLLAGGAKMGSITQLPGGAIVVPVYSTNGVVLGTNVFTPFRRID